MAQETNMQAAFENVMAASGNIPPKQKLVLAASLELFAEQGFANTTTKEIASRAGVAEGTVYKRYKTKDALLAAVLAPYVTEVVPAFVQDFAKQVVNQPYMTLHEMLTTVVTDRIAFIKGNRAVLQVLITEILVRSDLRKQLTPRVLPLLQKNLYAVLDRLKANAELVDWPNDRIAQFMIGTMITELARSIFTDEDLDQAGPVLLAFLEKGLAPK
ncbi:TetR/AcrR family transcriptional regulator [Levilactobacillus cerevisiae]|uniref:TetR/AcrR family transcriptional regulator n=1 Tax=Levilactobacillus cerevisiae TaxID=1704076 RepID=UPI000F7A27B4|nr:TetR/AcrR family transcriptional regulator [Levilactobacillus cerevisiae]